MFYDIQDCLSIITSRPTTLRNCNFNDIHEIDEIRSSHCVSWYCVLGIMGTWTLRGQFLNVNSSNFMIIRYYYNVGVNLLKVIPGRETH